MATPSPSNAVEVEKLVKERLKALEEPGAFKESVTVEWRGERRSLPVISMPVALLSYNPDTHRIRAQRSVDTVRDNELTQNPFGTAAQSYLQQLLAGDPSDPTKRDPSFDALKEDLKLHGQNDPGLITLSGVLVNGNTRRAALSELGIEHIRVGVLPADTSLGDLQSIELSLQLRRDYKRDYSFMNFLLAIDERVDLGRPAAEIQKDFRIKATTFERSRWILAFIRDAIERSAVSSEAGGTVSLRLIDFETDQGKLEELYRAYTSLKTQSPDEAEALREQRLLAIALDKSKTDVRLIESDFATKYLKTVVPEEGKAAPAVKIPGTTIEAPSSSASVEALKSLTTKILQAKAIEKAGGAAAPGETSKAADLLKTVGEVLDKGLDHAGKTGRVIKKKFAPGERISDAIEDIEFALSAVADAKASNSFDAADLDEPLQTLRGVLLKLARMIGNPDGESGDADLDGVAWLRSAVK